MTFYTFMYLVFANGTTAAISYPTPEECGAALLTAPTKMESVVGSKNLSAQCERTDVPSGSIRPRARSD